MEKIFIKFIQYLLENLHINIGSKNSPTLFFDFLFIPAQKCVKKIRAGFRLGYRSSFPLVPLSYLSFILAHQLAHFKIPGFVHFKRL